MTNNSTRGSADDSDEAPTSIPQTTPRPIGYGHPEYQFVQSIMEMQKSLGEINASIKDLNRSVESTRSKVDDLVKWKHMIVGGTIVLGIILGAVITIGTKVFDHIAFNPPQPVQTPQSTQQTLK